MADFDVIIIGGGPAGISTAIWCADVGLKPLLVERNEELGGQLSLIHSPIKNYPGVEVANGQELRSMFLDHLQSCDAEIVLNANVAIADLDAKQVNLNDGRMYSADAIIVATGVRRRALGIPGETEFAGRGILHSGAAERLSVAGKTVVIVGGGDAALENALILSAHAEKVLVVHRRSKFTARNEFAEKAHKCKNVDFVFDTRVTSILGNNRLEAIELQNTKSAERKKIVVGAVLIRIGVIPNTEIFRGQIALDESGYISIDSSCQTDLQNIYAIGDVATPAAPMISNAIGQGACAVKAIFSKKDQ